MKKIFKKNTLGLKIETPNGFKHFSGVAFMGNKKILEIHLSNKLFIRCAINHRIYISDTKSIPANKLILNQEVVTKSGVSKIESIIYTDKIEPVYDVIDVEDGHNYYTNGILSSNCEFITADSTLINAVTLLKLQGVNPLFKTNEIRWYEKIEPNKIYLIALDPSAGVGNDYSAIEVYCLPDMKQVAEWTHNRTTIPNQVRIMQNIVNFISGEMQKFPDQKGGEPDVYYTVENNSWGEAALQTINDISEDNFDGIMMHEPKSRNSIRRKGLNTNTRSKLMACTKLKTLLESEKLKVSSKALVRQLKFFVSKGDSFSAKSGENDDCVMATLLCIRMMQMATLWDESLENLLKDTFDDVEHEDPMPIVF